MSQHCSHSHFIQTRLLQLSLVRHWQKHLNRLQILQNKCARLILKQPSCIHASPLLRSLHWFPIKKRILFKFIVKAFKAFHFSSYQSYHIKLYFNISWSCLVSFLYIFNIVSIKLNTVSVWIWPLHLRSLVPKNKRAIVPFLWLAGAHLWNELPSSVRTVDHMDRFKNKLKSHLFLDSS